MSSFYYEQMGSLEMAVKYATTAIIMARDNFASFVE